MARKLARSPAQPLKLGADRTPTAPAAQPHRPKPGQAAPVPAPPPSREKPPPGDPGPDAVGRRKGAYAFTPSAEVAPSASGPGSPGGGENPFAIFDAIDRAGGQPAEPRRQSTARVDPAAQRGPAPKAKAVEPAPPPEKRLGRAKATAPAKIPMVAPDPRPPAPAAPEAPVRPAGIVIATAYLDRNASPDEPDPAIHVVSPRGRQIYKGPLSRCPEELAGCLGTFLLGKRWRCLHGANPGEKPA